VGIQLTEVWCFKYFINGGDFVIIHPGNPNANISLACTALLVGA
jgi:hypothetical protein